MEEQGVVVEVVGRSATVRVDATGGCEGCAASGACQAGSGGRVLEARNVAGAKPGQRVVLELQGGAYLRASFIIYMLPVIFLFAGAALGGVFGPRVWEGLSTDMWQALGGVLFLAASIVLIRLYDRKSKNTEGLSPVISRVIEG